MATTPLFVTVPPCCISHRTPLWRAMITSVTPCFHETTSSTASPTLRPASPTRKGNGSIPLPSATAVLSSAPLRHSSARSPTVTNTSSSTTAASVTTMTTGNNDGGSSKPEEPSPSGGTPPDQPPQAGKIITRALEIGFRVVWVQLLTAGVGPAYEEAITEFCLTCIAARKEGYTLRALQLELAANEFEPGTPAMQKFKLNDREKSTRLIWIAIVFLTLQYYNFPVGGNPADHLEDDIIAYFKDTQLNDLGRSLRLLVENVCAAADKGYTLETYKMELNLSRNVKDEPPSAATLSIQSQWSRFVFVTHKLLPEALRRKKQP